MSNSYILNQFSASKFLMSWTVPFQTIQFSISTQFKYGLIVKNIQFSQTVLIQIIQFNISMQLDLFNP